MRLRSRLLAIPIAFGLVFAIAPSVFAHAELVSSSPADGATVAPGPVTVTATYTEEIDPARSTIEVLDASGKTLGSGGVPGSDAKHTTMEVALSDVPAGTYTVRWTSVTPDDSGVLRGTFSFTVAAGDGAGGSVASIAAASPAASPGAGSSGGSGVDPGTVVPLVILVVVVAAGGVLVARGRAR